MNGHGFADADLPGQDKDPYFFQSVVTRKIDPGHAYVLWAIGATGTLIMSSIMT